MSGPALARDAPRAAPAPAPPPRRLEALFEAQARRTPAALAVLCPGEALSYAELDARADEIARRLRRLGAGPGTLVGVCLRRTPTMVAALLGVLKAGAAYVPLDPAYPTERLDYMLADSDAAVLLADNDVPGRLAYAGAVVDLRARADRRAWPERRPVRRRAPPDLAYVIYTSGSTGRPKGVMLGHTAVSLVEWARAAFTAGELARVAATTSICFDPSVFEIFAPLGVGGAIILKPNALKPFTPDERPTMLNCVPTVLAELCRLGAVPASVRVINVGGEPLSAALTREVFRRTKAKALYNHYGPTEATTCATVALAPRQTQADPPIGRPIAGAEIFVLDVRGQPARPGQYGEIHIGGPGLALGYLHRPELTDARFRPSPWGRLYRTGDLGRWSGDGALEFAGRVDQQVKIRGLRVELGEVEAALMRLSGVEAAAVVARPDARGRNRLTAFLQAPAGPTLERVRAALRTWLPEHMLPEAVVVLDALPLTLSGKVDRNALPTGRPPQSALSRPGRAPKGGAAE